MSDLSRKYSNFCVPISDSLPFHKNIMKNFRGIFRRSTTGNKYTSLNVLPLVTQGTLEYRGAGPITDKVQMIQMINVLQGLKATVRASAGASPEEFLNGVVQGYSPDVATAYALLKSYMEQPPEPAPRPLFTARNYGPSFRDTYRALMSEGGRSSMDHLLGIVAMSDSLSAPNFHSSPQDSSGFYSFSDIASCFITEGLTPESRAVIFSGLRCSARSSMYELWVQYHSITVRTKNRDQWIGPTRLTSVMTCRDLSSIGVSEDFIWRADVPKYNAWRRAKDCIREEGKAVPMLIDGRWDY
jgi:hypothetical protein